jgi:hypothetical protein
MLNESFDKLELKSIVLVCGKNILSLKEVSNLSTEVTSWL